MEVVEITNMLNSKNEDLIMYIHRLREMNEQNKSQKDLLKQRIEQVEKEKENWKQRYIGMVLNDAAGTLGDCDDDLYDIQNELESL